MANQYIITNRSKTILIKADKSWSQLIRRAFMICYFGWKFVFSDYARPGCSRTFERVRVIGIRYQRLISLSIP